MMRQPSRRRAAALILVLWAVTVLALMAGGMSFTLRQDLAISNLQRDRLVAHTLARAGVEYAIAAVMDDSVIVDMLEDACIDDSGTMQEVGLEGGTFTILHGSSDAIPIERYGAEDESGKLNINVASKDQLMKLPEMTEPIAAAIIDWRDRDDDPQSMGIEGSYYSNLPHPYEIRNQGFRTVRELLLVRDVTPMLFYGEDTNGNGLLDANEDDGETTDPPDNADGRLDRGWFAYVTVYSHDIKKDGYGRDRININSADANELASKLYLEDWAAKSIVKARENNEFKKLVSLLDVERASDEDAHDDPQEPEQDINAREDDEKDRPVTQAMFKRFVDRITLKGDEIIPGRININTAPREVLATLPGVDEELAEAIVQHRDGLGYFESIGELLDVDGIDKEKFGELENSVTVRSYVFRIMAEGLSDSGLAEASIECVVDRRDTEMPVMLYWRESMP